MPHDPAQSARLEMEGDGLAVLHLPGHSLFAPPAIARLEAMLTQIERGIESGAIGGLLVRPCSADPAEELACLSEAHPPDGLEALGTRVQAALRRLDCLTVPTLALLERGVRGSAAAIALACTLRLAADRPDFRFGPLGAAEGAPPLPGVLARLSWRIGPAAAARLVASGGAEGARAAHSAGVVDAVYPAAELLAAARRLALALPEGVRTGRRRPLATRWLEDSTPGRRLGRARIARLLRASVPASASGEPGLLESLVPTGATEREAALSRETERFTAEVASPDGQGRLYAALCRARSLASAASGDPIASVAVLGAGVRGTALAWRLSAAGISVRLRDADRDRLSRAMHHLEGLAAAGPAGRGPGQRPAPITAARGFGGFGAVDAILSADAVTPTALREVESHVRSDCLLVFADPLPTAATMAGALRIPGRLVGLHPVGLPGAEGLAELHLPEETTAPARLGAASLAACLRIPLLEVPDRPGLLLLAVLVPYLVEALRLRTEGAPSRAVDGVMEAFGFPVGPLRMVHALGGGEIERVARSTDPFFDPVEWHAALGAPEPVGEAREDSRGRSWLRGRRARSDGPPLEEIRSRLLLVLLAAGARALESGRIESPEKLDLALGLGAGFPARKGGLIFEARRRGAEEIVGEMERLSERHARFSPPPVLRHLLADC